VEEERRVAEDARQALVLLEKKRIALQTEIDDLHSALENVRRLSHRCSAAAGSSPCLGYNQWPGCRGF